jgi:hypothetical protein
MLCMALQSAGLEVTLTSRISWAETRSAQDLMSFLSGEGDAGKLGATYHLELSNWSVMNPLRYVATIRY